MYLSVFRNTLIKLLCEQYLDTKHNSGACIATPKKLTIFIRFFNDSDKKFGSHVDRHENIGEGFIGKKEGGNIDGLKRVFEIAAKRSIPMTLETHNIEKDLKKVQNWPEYKALS